MSERISRALLLLLLAAFLWGWAAYDWHRGGVTAYTGLTKFSPRAFYPREDDPGRFWLHVLAKIAGGILVIAMAVARLLGH